MFDSKLFTRHHVLLEEFSFFIISGTSTGGLLGVAPSTTFPNMVNQTMPNMPNYSGSVSGAVPGLLGMIPGITPGASGGVILPGVGLSLGEVCREYLYGQCAKTDCKFNHPPHNLLMTALAATTSMGTLSQVPMAPSAAAMAAAQAIVAAQALQAHAAQAQAQTHSAKDSSGIAYSVYSYLFRDFAPTQCFNSMEIFYDTYQ